MEFHTQKRIARILKARDAGNSFTEIGEAFGLSKGQVAGIIHRNRPKKKKRASRKK